MISHSNGFKSAITKLGRDINVLIDYYSVVYNLTTEDEKLIITQDNMELLTEEMPTPEPVSQLTNEDILSLKRNNLGELFRTYMKSFDLQSTHKFNVGDKMVIKVGTTVNGAIEYLNYGIYYIYERTYSEDTKVYTYTLCDRMLFTMQPYDNVACFGNATQLTCKQLITSILTNCGFDSESIDIDDAHLVNGSKIVYNSTFEGANMTYRDVLDMVIQLQGCSLVINYDEENNKEYIATKKISTSSVETIDSDILNERNIEIGKKYGKLNSLLFSRADGVDNIERKSESSIEENGETQYVIQNNYILDQDNRETYIDNLFSAINGLEYYECDIEIIGLGYIEYLDRFTIQTDENIYRTICLRNTSDIRNGMNESFKTDEISETKQQFENVGMSDKEASVVVNKLKGQIVLKTYVDENDGKTKISQVRLDSSGDEGSLVEIVSDNIKLEGYTTINGNFKIDQQGNMECKNGTFNGYINLNDNQNLGVEVFIIKGEHLLNNIDTNTECWCSSYDFTLNAMGDLSLGQRGRIYLQADPKEPLIYIDSDYYQKHLKITAEGMAFQIGSYPYQDSSYYLENGCYVDGQIASTGGMFAPFFQQTSKKEEKKNIEKYNDKALDILKNIDIYKFNYNFEDDEDKKHVGFVIGKDYNYDKTITGKENDGVDLYSFISVCCKAIQEQQKQIEELQKEIQKIKEKK